MRIGVFAWGTPMRILARRGVAVLERHLHYLWSGEDRPQHSPARSAGENLLPACKQ